MDGHVDGAPTLIDDLNHLLIGVTLWHTHQSTKLTDTMIDMHDIVAYLKLLYLLQRQGYLATTGLIRAQIILVETIEYLMVGKDAKLQVFVGKAFMERTFYAIEQDVTLLCKDITQTIQLLGTVSQDTQSIAISQITLQRLL